MPFSVNIDTNPPLVRVDLWDHVDLAVIREAVLAYLTLDDFQPGMGRLYILDPDCNLSDLSSKSLRDLSALNANEMASEMGKTGEDRYPVAIVCSTRVAEALMNLYKAIFDEGSWQDVELEVFSSEDVARSWLSDKLCKRL